jgi:hypothetical protein
MVQSYDMKVLTGTEPIKKFQTLSMIHSFKMLSALYVVLAYLPIVAFSLLSSVEYEDTQISFTY